MKIHLRKKKNRYAQVHENLLRNTEISMKAKGLGAWLELHENGFKMTFSFVEMAMKEGRESIQNSIKELQKNKFLLIEKIRNKKGQFRTNWYYDSEGLEPYTGFHEMGKPTEDNPMKEKGYQNIKDKPKKSKQKISSREGVIGRMSFAQFRQKIKSQYLGKPIVQGEAGYLKDTVISLTVMGYLHNDHNKKDLTGEDAKKLWQWLYQHQDRLLPP